MKTSRVVLWSTTVVLAGAAFLLDTTNVFPHWLIGGLVAVGLVGIAMLVDHVAFSPGRRNGYYLPLLFVGLSLGSVLQDAEIVVDEYSVWPMVVGALVLAAVLEAVTRHGHKIGPTSGAPAR